MKRILLVIMLLLSILSFSQEITSTIIADTIMSGEPIYMSPEAGSCASPDGANTPIVINPPGYAWLQANGYCYPSAYGTNPTVCWTFTPTSPSVSMNSGYSTTGCANISHGPFNLYDASCTLIGTGLNFTGLTPGNTYTWCMTSNAWGGGPGCIGFTDYCPYYFNNVVLPIELNYFKVTNQNDDNIVYWNTETETNNNYFTVERSTDSWSWNSVATIPGAGNSNEALSYTFKDKSYTPVINYYRLKQTDYNGAYTYSEVIAINNTRGIMSTTERVNILGQRVSKDYKGLTFPVR